VCVCVWIRGGDRNDCLHLVEPIPLEFGVWCMLVSECGCGESPSGAYEERRTVISDMAD
jgi:hypothetical protein